jgi:hypothetical protein
MTLAEVLVIMQNRIIVLIEARKSAVNAGDLDNVVKIDADLLTTLSSVEQIKSTIELTNNQ